MDRKEQRKRYYEKSKEKILEKAKVYYEENKEIIKARSKKYHDKNREEHNRKRREYYHRTKLNKVKEPIEIEKKVKLTEDRKKYQREYYKKNKDRWDTYYKKEKIKRNNNKPIKTRFRKKNENYINNIILTREIIICKGRGKESEKLLLMLYEICIELNRRFSYNDENLKYDIIHESYVHICGCYMGFNEDKYSNAFAYITEIIKRKQAMSFNLLYNNNVDIKEIHHL